MATPTNISGLLRTLILISIAFLLCPTVYAQDTLFYANGSSIVGTVEEIGIDQVHYRTTSGASEVKIIVEKRDLSRVVLQGGQVLEFNGATGRSGSGAITLSSYPEAVLKKTHALKIDFIAPTLNHFTVGYEHGLGRVAALEIKLGYIGIQTKDHIYDRGNTSGFLAKVGIKFIHRPERSNDHPLTGWYLKPELMYSQWSDTRMANVYGPYPYSYSTSEVRTTVNSAAFNLVIGRQILIGGAVTLDVFCGIGYGFQDRTDRSDLYDSIRFNPYAYSHIQVGEFVPLAFSGGMLFGIAF